MENPFATIAPPPQTMAHPSVQISYDDDDILMDYDDDGPSDAVLVPIPAAAPITPSAAPEPMQDLDTDQLAHEKVFLKGVDNMSTANVKAFVAEHFTAASIVKVEWIDDSSCCLVYRTPEEAAGALSALALEQQQQELPALAIRPAKLASSHPDSRLEVRIARQTDKKIAGARDRSRYYLFNPEEDRVEQAARLRREREEARRNRRRNDTDGGEYERRHYDSREHDRRRNVDSYTDNFYDDDVSSRNSRNVSRSRNSRDRSYSPARERRQRSRSPIELFPGRVSRNRSRELFPERMRMEESGRLRTEPLELFPRKPAASSRFSVSPGPGPGPVELFPEKLGHRIKRPAKKSLEERINLDSGSGSDRDTGYRIKGRGGKTADDGNDLFAQKLRAAKGEGLVVEEGGRRRGGARRNRAEDMFG